jgi:hypothetical protein
MTTSGGRLSLVVIALLIVAACGGGNDTSSGDPSPAGSSSANLMGINIRGGSDWMEGRLYADLIRMSRNFLAAGTNGNGPSTVPVDANGWPTTDFSFLVWAGIDKMHGTYVLSFQGQAVVSGNDIGNVALSYDPATNTSTGTFQYTEAASYYLFLNFVDTKRTAASATGTGVSRIKLMRPLTPGSTQTHPVSELFNRAAKAELTKFQVVRYMGYLGVEWSPLMNWSDRPLPSWASFNRNPGGIYGWEGIGGPLEYVIRLSNETATDPWINIPSRATDDYVRNMALTLAYGSDGINPYTSPQSNPVYPPLNPNRKIYVEYSNEVWNPMYSAFADNCKAASDELVASAGNSPLNYDKSWNGVTWIENDPNHNQNFDYYKCWRRIAERGVEISNIFRSVFGDSAMGARIRPELMTQQNNGQNTLVVAARMMFGYYDNGEGNFVSIPHPPSYYFYGAGGSGYYNPVNLITSLDGLFSDPGMTPNGSGWAPLLQRDAEIVAAMGLKRVCYEGGPGLATTNGPADAIFAQAVNDARMTTTVVDMHNSWSSYGGELFVYFEFASDYQWGFTNNIYDLVTPKLLAIDQLNLTPRWPTIFGALIPATVAGTSIGVCYGGTWAACHPQGSANYAANGGQILWASYTFRSSGSVTLSVKLSTSQATSAQVAVYFDDVLLGTQNASAAMLTFSGSAIDPGVHSVIVRAVSGNFTLDSVTVD